ncbi:MAG TPA: Ycf66 family protein [Thermosynechococcaceae cyanobacterium]
MLAYLLALAVGLGSFALYIAAFFFPEVHRKNDFIWSGVGLFYALVLWVCAERITGGVLLGQTASVSLVGWLGWQTLTLRRQVAPAEQQTAVPTSEEVKAKLTDLASPEAVSKLSGQVGQQFGKLKAWGQEKLSAQKLAPQPTEEPYVPLTPADFATPDRPPTTDTAIGAIDATAPLIVPKPAPEAAIAPEAAPKSTPKPAGGIGSAFQQMLGGFNKKHESKPVYVRKQFRKPEGNEAEADEVETISATLISQKSASQPQVKSIDRATDNSAIVEDIDIPSDAILQEEIAYESTHATPDASSTEAIAETPSEATLEPVPPHPPAPELVEAALIDAEEKGVPADPPLPEADSSEQP